MTLLFYWLLPWAVFGLFMYFAMIADSGVITRSIKKDKFDPVKAYGYDPESPMVQHFQRLAGIEPRNTSYRNRFNLSNMV